MIVPMLKLSLLVFHEEYREFLEKLRDMGVVHINANRERSAADELLQEKLRLAKHVDDVVRTLDALSSGDEEPEQKETELAGEELINAVDAGFRRKEQIVSEKLALQKDLAVYAPWGEIPVEKIGLLKDAGWHVGFYAVQERNFDETWTERFNAVKVAEDKGNVYFVTVTPAGMEEKPETEPYLFPEKSPEELRSEIAAVDAESAGIDSFLLSHRESMVKALRLYQQQIYGVTDMCKVQDATEAILDGKVKFMEGWIPVEKADVIKAELDKFSVSYELTQPIPGDDVPVQLKNNRFARLFEPVTEMFALPKYTELDPTPFFAPFFMLFFGLCLGDGGYGIIICAVCAYLLKKVPESMKGLLKLAIVLGAATVVVGILTGSFFGIALADMTWPWLRGVKEYFVTAGNYSAKLGGYDPMMVFAVIIGLVQIFFGMIVSAMQATKQYGIRYAWSTLGWVAGLITAAFAFGLPLLGVSIPAPILYAMYAIMAVSVFAIVFLNSPGKNVFMNIGTSLWNTYNMATGILGDTLSYIRLFALGLTGSILGGVFNTLAFDLTADASPYVRWIAVLLILLIGHAINFGLCMIGAFVHPLRLTFVEFYKNASFEGGGQAYAPLKNRLQENK